MSINYAQLVLLAGAALSLNLLAVKDSLPHREHHNTQEITIPFVVRTMDGKKLFSDFMAVHVSDDALTITKKIQMHAMKTFKAMSAQERLKLGGFEDYGLDSQRWIVFQGTKIFKLFSREQVLIDNYDRLNRTYHMVPLTLYYFT